MRIMEHSNKERREGFSMRKDAKNRVCVCVRACVRVRVYVLYTTMGSVYNF